MHRRARACDAGHPAGRRVTTDDGLAAWNAAGDTTGVVLPGLLADPTFAVLERRDADGITMGCIATLGTGAVYLSNVHAAPGHEADWARGPRRGRRDVPRPSAPGLRARRRPGGGARGRLRRGRAEARVGAGRLSRRTQIYPSAAPPRMRRPPDAPAALRLLASRAWTPPTSRPSSSAPARPAWPPATTCSDAAARSSSSTAAPASATSGAASTTPCGSTPPPSTTACRACRSPAPGWSFPGKDDVADYLEQYAAHHDLPVRLGVRVTALDAAAGRWLHRHHRPTGAPTPATTSWSPPAPSAGRRPSPTSPASSTPGSSSCTRASTAARASSATVRVLVVGASHSGTDIAYELAQTHPTTLAGRDCGQIPVRWDSWLLRVFFPVVVAIWRHVLTRRTPMGRKEMKEVRAHGGPMLRVKRDDLADRGVERLTDRVTGVRDGRPVVGDRAARRRDRRVGDRLPAGLRLDPRCPSIGEDGWPVRVARRRRGPARPVLLRAVLPVRVQLDGARRASAGTRTSSPSGSSSGRPARCAVAVG